MPTWSLVSAPAYLTIHLLRKYNALLPLTILLQVRSFGKMLIVPFIFGALPLDQ